MKKSKLVLLFLGMTLCAGAGVGSAIALTRNQATGTGTGSFDKAIYLYWGANDSQRPESLADLSDLAVNVPQYSFLSVTPSASASVTGSVTVTFTLANDGEDKDVKGITVDIYKTETLLTDDTVNTLTGDADLTLKVGNLTGTSQFNVGPNVAAYYCFKVTYDGTPQGDSKTLGGTVTISQAYSTDILED